MLVRKVEQLYGLKVKPRIRKRFDDANHCEIPLLIDLRH